MSRTSISLIVLVLACCTCGLLAADIHWDGGAGDLDWTNPMNWDGDVLPGASDRAFSNTTPGPVISTKLELNWLIAADGGNAIGEITLVDGADVIVHSQTMLGGSNGSAGTINMLGGALANNANMNVCWRGKGTVNMYASKFSVSGNMFLNPKPTADALLNLYGGTTDVSDLNIGNDGRGRINIGGGTLIVGGDQTGKLEGYIDNGHIIAYRGLGQEDDTFIGEGTLHMDYNVSNAGKTTITATHPLAPIPGDASIIPAGATELSWTLADSVDKVDVWFTSDVDQIFNGDPVALVVDGKKDTAVNVTADPKVRYYWAVDTYTNGSEEPTYGPIFSFLADNAPPVVNVGLDVSTVLINGTRTGPLRAIVSDDGQIQPYTLLWSIVTEPDDPNLPDAVITDPTSESTDITLSAVGQYLIKLEANDGEYIGEDSLVITVHADDWADEQ